MSEHLFDTNVGNIEYIRKKDAVSRISDLLVLELKMARLPTWNEVYNAIGELSSADVAPVVRCKDCKFYTSMRPDIKTGICDLNVHHMGDDGFCSCGERREE